MKGPSGMKSRDRMQMDKEVPIWLKGLHLVRDELRGTCFPRTPEEGVRQCAELSAASMALLREEVKKGQQAGKEKVIEKEICWLMARFSSMNERWKSDWSKECVASKE